jgi:cytochrome c oxidase cbb3-type subunit III
MRRVLGCSGAVCALLLTAACDRSPPAPPDAALTERQSQWRTSTLQAGTATPLEITPNPYEANERAIAEGRRLYRWMNCAGCHGTYGGGGIGPPLADDDWIYGGESMHIYQSIMQGRPNGMPAYAGKLTVESGWQVAAYVRTLSADGRSSGEDAEDDEGGGPTDHGAMSGPQRGARP